MSVTVRQEKEVTIDDVVSEANVIYAKCKKLYPGDDSEERLKEIHNQMVDEHTQFAHAYPIVLRYMCELKQYRQKAFKKYLGYIKHHPWTSEDSFFESQAMYVTLLYKEINPRWDKCHTENLFDNTVRMLKIERDAFNEQIDKNKEEVKRDHSRMMRRNTLELKQWFSQHGATAVDVPLRAIVCDEDGNERECVITPTLEQIGEPDADIDELYAF
jgi:hypothetical protein